MPRDPSSTAEARITGACDLTPPKMVAKATSAASRPVPKRTKPIGMAVPDGSKIYLHAASRQVARRQRPRSFCDHSGGVQCCSRDRRSHLDLVIVVRAVLAW